MRPKPPRDSALVNFLKRKDPALYGKLFEVRAEVERLLTYVPQTFPHYTSHTIDHSDEIVTQISKLLFAPRARKPVIDIGPVAAYILIVAAYLHDAGMVASDSEKARILASDEWQKWLAQDWVAKQWAEIEKLRRDAGDDAGKNFSADRATRLLIAEFIRRQHHRRAGELVRTRALELGRIDVRERMLRDSIADICVAHGLDWRELEDDYRFPQARDLLDETVNIRLLATLLRLGDLLDLRSDRACPLVLQAASPLPPDSMAHWSQYERIDRLTSPEKIKIRAQCRNPDEHRVLHDWCSWLVREVETIPARLPGISWTPPIATMDRKESTIVIEPAPDATYVPGNWRFELDEELIFQRLIGDVYDSPEVFLRELIQNALDASRCRMYADLKSSGAELPEFPPDVAEDVRERYPLVIRAWQEDVPHGDSDGTERVQFVSVEDRGTGMDQDVIRRHFLQAGRSYYTTAEFKSAYPFHPTSRFGVGFLSVFAVSDDVVVETYNPDSSDGPLRLRLTGPRSYLLMEKGEREQAGTTITVRLRKPLPTPVHELVRQWCVFVEFPISIVKGMEGAKEVIPPTEPMLPELEISVPSEPGVRYVRRVYPVSCHGIRGFFSAIARIENGEERWIHPRWFQAPLGLYEILRTHKDMLGLHGIVSHSRWGFYLSHLSAWLDIRRPANVTLSRNAVQDELAAPDLDEILENIVVAHLGDEETDFDLDRLQYRTQLMNDDRIGRLTSMWHKRRDIIPVWQAGSFRFYSVDELLGEPRLYFMPMSRKKSGEAPFKQEARMIESAPGISRDSSDAPMLTYVPLEGYQGCLYPLARVFAPVAVRWVGASSHLVVELNRDVACEMWGSVYSGIAVFLDMPECHFDIVKFDMPPVHWSIFNTAAEFGRWGQRLLKVHPGETLRHGRIAQLLTSLCGEHYTDVSILTQKYLKDWNQWCGDTPELQCPNLSPTIAI